MVPCSWCVSFSFSSLSGQIHRSVTQITVRHVHFFNNNLFTIDLCWWCVTWIIYHYDTSLYQFTISHLTARISVPESVYCWRLRSTLSIDCSPSLTVRCIHVVLWLLVGRQSLLLRCPMIRITHRLVPKRWSPFNCTRSIVHNLCPFLSQVGR